MFADGTNLFYSHKSIKTSFETNSQVKRKTKYTFFHQARKSDYIPLKLSTLKINNSEIKGKYCIKFLGVLLDECLTWKQHTRCFFYKKPSE